MRRVPTLSATRRNVAQHKVGAMQREFRETPFSRESRKQPRRPRSSRPAFPASLANNRADRIPHSSTAL